MQENNVCPICGRRIRRIDGPAFMRHVKGCRVRSARKAGQKRKRADNQQERG